MRPGSFRLPCPVAPCAAPDGEENGRGDRRILKMATISEETPLRTYL
jgi:hypothetical protein